MEPNEPKASIQARISGRGPNSGLCLKKARIRTKTLKKSPKYAANLEK